MSEKEATKVAEELKNIATQGSQDVGRKTRVQYEEKDKIRISRYAILHGNRQAVTHFAAEFPKLNESCVRRWASKYKSQLTEHPNPNCIVIGAKRGRPTLLSAELDAKLQAMIENLRMSGAPINLHTVRGVLAGLVRSDVEKYGHYLDFQVTMGTVALSRYEISSPYCNYVQAHYNSLNMGGDKHAICVQ